MTHSQVLMSLDLAALSAVVNDTKSLLTEMRARASDAVLAYRTMETLMGSHANEWVNMGDDVAKQLHAWEAVNAGLTQLWASDVSRTSSASAPSSGRAGLAGGLSMDAASHAEGLGRNS